MMSDKIYNVSKEAAAQLIGVSTRTIDRYISDEKLSSKKVGNKVMLNQLEVLKMRSEYDQVPSNNGKVNVISADTLNSYERNSSSSIGGGVNIDELASLLDEKFEKFEHALQEKDHLIEDKNKVIFMLQNKVGELETRIKSMIALPDYTQEKQELMDDKKKMEHLIEKLESESSKMGLENRVYLTTIIIVIIMVGLYALMK